MTRYVLDTRDIDQARELLSRTIVPFSLTPCRPSGYHARVRAGRVGNLSVAEVSYQGAVDIRCRAPDDTVILEIPVAGHCRAEPRASDHPIQRGNVVATLPSRPIRTWMGDRCRLLLIRIPAAVLDPSGEWDLVSFEPLRWIPSPTLNPDRLASLERLAALVFEETAESGAVASDDTLGAELQQVLLALLGAPTRGMLYHQTPEDRARLAPRSVRRAQALMIAAPSGDLSVQALASRCGVSVRTLQENFRQFAGTTPSEWWRGYRLERVRKALSESRPGVGVTETATAYGFFHLGRFAKQYRSQFGEMPSETLRRAREAV